MKGKMCLCGGGGVLIDGSFKPNSRARTVTLLKRNCGIVMIEAVL